MRAKVDGKWKTDTKGIKDTKMYDVELPRRKEIIDGQEYEYFSQTKKMSGRDLRKFLEKK